MNPLDVISPAELIKDYLDRLCPPDLAPAGVVVGPANDRQQQAGVISLVDAGMPVVEFYVPTISVRTQARCLAGTLEGSDHIVRGLQAVLNGVGRTVARMASTDRRYLIHRINVVGGPSMHYDSPETWETLLFAEVMYGTVPIS